MLRYGESALHLMHWEQCQRLSQKSCWTSGPTTSKSCRPWWKVVGPKKHALLITNSLIDIRQFLLFTQWLKYSRRLFQMCIAHTCQPWVDHTCTDCEQNLFKILSNSFFTAYFRLIKTIFYYNTTNIQPSNSNHITIIIMIKCLFQMQIYHKYIKLQN